MQISMPHWVQLPDVRMQPCHSPLRWNLSRLPDGRVQGSLLEEELRMQETAVSWKKTSSCIRVRPFSRQPLKPKPSLRHTTCAQCPMGQALCQDTNKCNLSCSCPEQLPVCDKGKCQVGCVHASAPITPHY